MQTAHLCNERPEEESLGHHRVKRLDERTNEADDVNEQRGRGGWRQKTRDRYATREYCQCGAGPGKSNQLAVEPGASQRRKRCAWGRPNVGTRPMLWGRFHQRVGRVHRQLSAWHAQDGQSEGEARRRHREGRTTRCVRCGAAPRVRDPTHKLIPTLLALLFLFSLGEVEQAES